MCRVTGGGILVYRESLSLGFVHLKTDILIRNCPTRCAGLFRTDDGVMLHACASFLRRASIFNSISSAKKSGASCREKRWVPIEHLFKHSGWRRYFRVPKAYRRSPAAKIAGLDARTHSHAGRGNAGGDVTSSVNDELPMTLGLRLQLKQWLLTSRCTRT